MKKVKNVLVVVLNIIGLILVIGLGIFMYFSKYQLFNQLFN